MAIFKTTDNNGGKRLQVINQEYGETDFKAAVSDIKRISNKTLAELSTEENLLNSARSWRSGRRGPPAPGGMRSFQRPMSYCPRGASFEACSRA